MLSDGKVQSLQLHLQQDDDHFSSLPSKDNFSLSSMMTTSSSPCSSFRSVYYGVASAGAVPFIWELQPGTPKYTFCDPDHDTVTISTTTTAAAAATAIPPSPPPPLTPPPSYFSTSNQKSKSNEKKSSSKKHKILNSIFPKMRINAAVSSTHSQAHDVPLSSLSSSSSSSTTTTRTKSSSSSSCSPTRTSTPLSFYLRSRFSSPRSSCSPTRTSTPLSFYLRNRFSSPRSSFDSRGDDGDVMFGSPTSTLRSVSNSRVVGDEEICNDGLVFRGCYSMVNMKKALLSIVGTSSCHGSSAQPSPTVAA